MQQWKSTLLLTSMMLGKILLNVGCDRTDPFKKLFLQKKESAKMERIMIIQNEMDKIITKIFEDPAKFDKIAEEMPKEIYLSLGLDLMKEKLNFFQKFKKY